MASTDRSVPGRAFVLCALTATLAQACALDQRTLTTEDTRTQDAGIRFANPPWQVDGSRYLPPEGAAGDGAASGGSGGAGRGGSGTAGMGVAGMGVAGTPDGQGGTGGIDGAAVVPKCCATLDDVSGTCSNLDEHCADADAARLSELEAWLRVVARSGAFVECMNFVMRVGTYNIQTLAAAVPSGGCAGISPPYEQTGYGPYVSCRPEADPENGGVPGGDSHGDPAWNEMPDRQLSRALNAAQLELALDREPNASGGVVRAAGYDAAAGVSVVDYAGPARALTFEDALGSVDDASGFLPAVMQASARNLGYDNGCRAEEPLGTDHGNCGRDPESWNPDRTLNAIAGFCVKEILLRSALSTGLGCGTEGSGMLQTPRSCPQDGRMIISSFRAEVQNVPCHCVPDPERFARSSAGDEFGAALAVGHFDGDGYFDLAVGVPNKRFPGASARGGVLIYRGARIGFVPSRSFSADELGLTNDDGARCGAALVSADFNGDAVDDLAIGCPGFAGAGAVALLPGCGMGCEQGLDGLQPRLVQLLEPEAAGEFGYALAAGWLSADDYRADLAVGSPAADGVVPSAGRVDVYHGQPTGLLLLHEREVLGPASFARFGAALAIGDVQDAPAMEIVVGAPEHESSGAVFVVSAEGTARIDASIPFTGTRFGIAVATGRFFGSELDDIVIAAPSREYPRLYRATGASAGPSAATEAWAYDQAAAPGALAVMRRYNQGAFDLLAVGQPGANQVTIHDTTGSALELARVIGPDTQPFWSAPPDPRGYCPAHGDLAADVMCPIDALPPADVGFGSALAFAGYQDELAIGAPYDLPDMPASAGAVYLRGGHSYYDDLNYVAIHTLEARIDQESTFYAGSSDRDRFADATEWSDYLCVAGETCMTLVRDPGEAPTPDQGRAGVVVFSKDVDGKEGDVWVAEPAAGGFARAERWHDSFCTVGEICAVADVDGDVLQEPIAFVQNATAGHENHMHVLRCPSPGCTIEEWQTDFCRAGKICRFGRLTYHTTHDLIEFDPNGGTYRVAISSTLPDPGYEQYGEGAFTGEFCATGEECLLADVNGDDLDDVVELSKGDDGTVWVGLARIFLGGFKPLQKWHDRICLAGQECRLADVNGDLRADVVVFVRDATAEQEGNVWVALSNGNDFGPAELWSTDLCRGQQTCLVGDFDGDKRRDALVLTGATAGQTDRALVARSVR